MEIEHLWKLYDDVLTGKAPAIHIVAVFDEVLRELERRLPKKKKVVRDPNQLELFQEELL